MNTTTRRVAAVLQQVAFALFAFAPVAAVSPASAQDAEDAWWRDAVFYEIFVRSFQDSTTGPLANDGVGDFRGLIDRLDYLNDGDPSTTDDLGVTGIWLMPIKQSPSYHGYDVVDYRSIDDEYGTNDDFMAFTQAARDRGIRVIVDLVLNHCASDHPWFQKALAGDPEFRDWFVWRDEKPGWADHMWHGERGTDEPPYYFGFFWHGMPDLNLENPEVTRAWYDLSRYWLTTMGVDGFRLDAIRHLIEVDGDLDSTEPTIRWIERYNAFLEGVKPGAFSVGEVWGDTDEVKQYIPHALDSAFEFALAGSIVSALADDEKGAAELRRRIDIVDESYPPHTVSTFLTNHDQNRVMSEFGGPDTDGFARAKAAATLLLTLPGVPFIYYGEEIGMTGTKPDPDIRTPMQWTPDATRSGFTNARPWRAVNGDTRAVNVRRQAASDDSLLSRYRDLIRLRQQTPALSRGTVTTLDTANTFVLAYLRELDGEQVLVLVNTSPMPVRRYELDPRDFGDAETYAGESMLSRRAVTPSLNPRLGAQRLVWTPMPLAPFAAEVIRVSPRN